MTRLIDGGRLRLWRSGGAGGNWFDVVKVLTVNSIGSVGHLDAPVLALHFVGEVDEDVRLLPFAIAYAALARGSSGDVCLGSRAL